MELVYIKPGTFVMGGESEKDGRFECVEVPKHEVTLTKGFYLGKYEVTQAQYQLIMGENPSRATKDPNCPADTIGEADAVDFCEKLAEKTGQEVRLPTEAEWEYACRAGSKTAWFFGDDPAQLGDYAWFKDNDGGKSHPVGQKKPNPWGLYDMYGNVCERVADTYARDYYAKSPKEDPTGPARTRYSMLRVHDQRPASGNVRVDGAGGREQLQSDAQRLCEWRRVRGQHGAALHVRAVEGLRAGHAHPQGGREHPAVLAQQSAAGRDRRQVVHLEAGEVGRSHIHNNSGEGFAVYVNGKLLGEMRLA